MNLGLDIGYSGLKLAYGPKGQRPTTLALPVGAAPTQQIGANYLNDDEGVRVLIDGEPWAACVQPYMASHSGRSLDQRYTETRQYRALYHAALKTTGATHIDCVATGLPVRQYFNEGLRDRLARMLKGRHQVDADRVVEVADAKIYPQPAGMYIAFLTGRPNGPQEMNDQMVLVIDPGFFSVDSVVIRHNRPYPNAVATSTQAMSRVIEMADEAITHQFSDDTTMPGLYKAALEERLRERRTDIRCYGRLIDARPYLEQAAAVAGKRALDEITASLRGVDLNIDVVLVAGGGASLYAPVIRHAFPHQRVMIMQDAPIANAHGFWVFAGGGA